MISCLKAAAISLPLIEVSGFHYLVEYGPETFKCPPKVGGKYFLALPSRGFIEFWLGGQETLSHHISWG